MNRKPRQRRTTGWERKCDGSKWQRKRKDGTLVRRRDDPIESETYAARMAAYASIDLTMRRTSQTMVDDETGEVCGEVADAMTESAQDQPEAMQT